ncbi:MAG TPA: nucleoside triphosphate pyrophosphohydrolase [Desulfobacterales bacterium]|nr:nucleoside triphosphate pyrophosphohydrolase [Desulfobacterales bacterium]
MTTTEQELQRLDKIITALRNPESGCPWDKKQTPETMKTYLLEECYETVEAIDSGRAAAVREEMGDLFFQLVFISQLYEEQHAFSLTEVISGIADKMVHRHPHVFGDEKVGSAARQSQRWNEIKAAEKKTATSAADRLTGVPKSLPALRRAQRVSERAAHNGFEWSGRQAAINKFSEETEELLEAMKDNDQNHIIEEMGDVLFMLVNLARLYNINAEDTMHLATEKFIRRFRGLENLALEEGLNLHDLSETELLNLWQRNKNNLT